MATSADGPNVGARLLWAAYSHVYDLLWDNELTEEVGRRVVGELVGIDEILEVGSGTGLITKRLIAVGKEVTACEPHPGMRERCRRRCPEVTLLSHTLESLTPSGRRCGVVAVNVIHLTPNPRATVEHLRLLSSSGPVVLVTPQRGISIATVARAMRRRGSGRVKVARFVALHVLLAPLIAVARPLAATSNTIDALSVGGVVAGSVDDVSNVIVIKAGRDLREASASPPPHRSEWSVESDTLAPRRPAGGHGGAG
jgi:hypothetical protein